MKNVNTLHWIWDQSDKGSWISSDGRNTWNRARTDPWSIGAIGLIPMLSNGSIINHQASSIKHQARAARLFRKASSPPPIVFFCLGGPAQRQAPTSFFLFIYSQASSLPPWVGPPSVKPPLKKRDIFATVKMYFCNTKSRLFQGSSDCVT